MVSKKRNKKPPATDSSSAPAPAPPGETRSWRDAWPADFPTPRATLWIAAALVFLTLAIFVLAHFNQLYRFKVLVAWLMGLSNPQQVQPGSFDAAFVVWFAVMTLGLALIHPVCSLGLLLLLRPWLDGYTYPTENVYFLWAIMVAFILWAVRALFRGDTLRHLMPAGLLGGFFLVALATLPGTLEFYTSFQRLLFWFSYLMLLVLAANVARHRTTFGILLAVLVCALLAEAVFAILHYHYLLPMLRKIVQDPDQLERWFGTREMTPELARRFNRNRAFGSMLFPNSLAAFLILLIPAAAAGGLLSARALIPAWRGAAQLPKRGAQARSRRYRGLACGGVAWLVATIVFFMGAQFPAGYQAGPPAWYTDTYALALLAGLAGLVPAAAVSAIAGNRGGRACWLSVQCFVCSIAVLAGLAALWYSFSRGAMLALAVSGVFTILLIWRGGHGWAGLLPRKRATGGLVAAAAALGAGLLAMAPPDDSAQARPPLADAGSAQTGQAHASTVSEEGVDLTAADLVDPSTLRIRLTYWQVGLRVWRHYFWTGVGLGNFALAYPAFQFLGAGDVREAHNALLEACCETGVLGGLIMAAFFAYLALWSAWRILKEQSFGKRLALGGLYAGLLAFLLHSGLDINFSHPSLMMFMMAVTGLLAARAALPAPEAPGGGDASSKAAAGGRFTLVHQLLLLVLIVGAGLSVGLSMRLFLKDLALTRVSFVNLKSRDRLEQKLNTGHFFLVRVRALNDPNPKKKRPSKLPIPVSQVLPFFNSPEKIMAMGDLYAPLKGRKGARPLRDGDTVPPNAIWVVKDTRAAARYARRCAHAWLEELKRMDARFPHSPYLAKHIAEWYKLLANNTNSKDRAALYQEYLGELERWGSEAVRRSPHNADIHLAFGSYLTTVAKNKSGRERLETWQRVLKHFELARQMGPLLPGFYGPCKFASNQLARLYESAGQAGKAKEYRQRAQEIDAKKQKLLQARWRAGLG